MQLWLTDQQAYPGDVIVLVSIIAESTGQGGTGYEGQFLG